MRLLPLGILLGAFALRVYSLQQHTLWYDEAFSIFLAERDPSAIIRGTAVDIQPPLYYFLLHFWQTLGAQLFVQRFLPAAFSLLSVPLTCALARRLFSKRVAVLGMLLVAIMPLQIYFAQELRMYSLLALASLAYFYAFARLLQGERQMRVMFLFVLSGAVALYSQSLAVLTWIVPDVYLLLAFLFRPRIQVRAWKSVLIGQAITLLLFLPWVLVLLSQFAQIQSTYWTVRPGLIELIQLLIGFTTNLPLPDVFLPTALFVTLMVDTLLLIQIARVLRRRPSPGLILIATLCVVPPVLMFVLSYVMRSIFVVRAATASSLAFAILLAWLLDRVGAANVRYGLALLAMLMAAISLAYYYGYEEFPRSPYAQADAFLRSNVRMGDAIVHDNKLSFFPMHYYDRMLAQAWIADPAEAGSNTLAPDTMQVMQIFPTTLDDATRGQTRIWFVMFQQAIDEVPAEQREQTNLAWMDRHWRRESVYTFNDLNIFLYNGVVQP